MFDHFGVALLFNERLVGLYKTKTQHSIATSTIYNMSDRVILDIQTRAKGERLYVRYNTDGDANIVKYL